MTRLKPTRPAKRPGRPAARRPGPARKASLKSVPNAPRAQGQDGMIPVAAAQDVAERYGLSQVIVLCWDGKVQHCVTYGTTVVDADQAALGGDRLKKALGWPERTMGHLPPRVQQLQQKLHDLILAGQRVVEDWDQDVPDYTPNVEGLRDAIEQAQLPELPGFQELHQQLAAALQQVSELQQELRSAEQRAERAEAYYEGPGLGT